MVDDLQYNYSPLSGVATAGNQLNKVTDLQSGSGGMGANNGKLNDFFDGANGSADDYLFDAGGNLVKDLNKEIGTSSANGIEYNMFNKPVKITINNKAIIEYVYDGYGQRRMKKVTDLVQQGQPLHTTFYNGQFIYTDQELQYVLHEEGRMKIINPVSGSTDREWNAGSGGVTLNGGKQGVFEYYLTDHLGNTRMILSEEVKKEFYNASMELDNSPVPNTQTKEEQLFGQVDANGNPTANNELVLTRVPRNPNIWPETAPDPTLLQSVVKLSALSPNTKTGPNMILRVMAGDKINAKVDYFYLNNNNQSSGTPAPLQSLVTSLIGALSGNGLTEFAHLNPSVIQSGIAGDGILESFLNDRYNTGTAGTPKAYLNIIFFDDQFKFIANDPNSPSTGTQSIRVSQANAQNVNLLLQQKAPKNGWAYIYLSNDGDEAVYFDNLAITHEHGRIVDESHYYPFGSKIAAISSTAFGQAPNKYGYQGVYAEEETLTGYSEFDLRMYDPVIGRWINADPYSQYPTPYAGMGNDPVTNTDPSGGYSLPIFAWISKWMYGGESTGRDKATGEWYVAEWSYGTDGDIKSSRRFSDDKLLRIRESEIIMDGVQRAYIAQHDGAQTDFSKRLAPGSGPNLIADGRGGYVWGWNEAIDYPAIDPIDVGAGLMKGFSILAVKQLGKMSAKSVLVAGERALGDELTELPLRVLAKESDDLAKSAGKEVAAKVHGNSLASTRPTWGYKLYTEDGVFLKNGITSQPIPEARYTKSFMSDKYMESSLFPNRRAAWDWEASENLISPGPLNLNGH
jgi:RHS repeat-associated protein